MGCTVLPSYWTQTWSALPAMFHAINAFMQMERKCVREHLWINSILSYVQNSEIQPRASSLGLHVQEMKMTPAACSLYVCSQQIYSFSHTWMIPEWNQELQMNTPGHLGLPAARVHVVTYYCVDYSPTPWCFKVWLQAGTRWALIHLSRSLTS